MNVKNWSIKRKLIFSYFIIVLIPVMILGIVSYLKAETALFSEVQSKLEKGVEQYRQTIEREMSYTQEEKQKGHASAKKIVANLAASLMPLLDKYQNGNNLEQLKKEIASLQVGESGYVFILDYQGNYVVSYQRKADGKNILDAKDAKGNFFIQEIIAKGKQLPRGNVDFQVYPWQAKGETELKDKVAALVHLPEHQWILGVSAYFHDLVDDNQEQMAIDRFAARLKSEKIGKTGYMFVMDGQGNILFHPSSSLEGKNLLKYPFIQEMAKNKNGFSRYFWEGKEKIVAYSYFADRDWIIASGSYLADFTDPIIEIRNLTLIILVSAVTLALVLAWLLSNSIVNPILKITDGIRSSSHQVSAASHQLSSASQELSQASVNQASSLEEASASLEEITGMVKNSAQGSKDCSELTERIMTSSKKADHSMQELALAMDNILTSNQKIQDLVKVIGQIGEKTEVIDEIVFQTKLLSFNASVEAERAGEHGRGFAVVAQEVGNLAQMSGKAAVEISNIVKESIQSAEVITRENKQKVEGGSQLSSDVAQILKGIDMAVSEAKEHMKSIASASDDQTRGLTQLNAAVAQLDKATQENAGVAEETASSSEELSAQADNLNAMISELGTIVLGRSKKKKKEEEIVEATNPDWDSYALEG